MKKFYKTDWFLKVVSVFVSIILWIYVAYFQNPEYETSLEILKKKVEIQNIRILRANRHKSYAKVTGQLFRFFTSSNNTSKQAQVLDFELNIEMVVNFNLATESRYPFNITKLTYSTMEAKDKERQNNL